jgi:hypothetical protein
MAAQQDEGASATLGRSEEWWASDGFNQRQRVLARIGDEREKRIREAEETT